MLKDVRCKTKLDNGNTCNRLLGKIEGDYEIKCPRCKGIQTNLHQPYDKIKGDCQ